MNNFAVWLGALLGQSEFAVHRLLKDKSALHFLITWSLFESKCFGGYVKLEKIGEYSTRIAAGLQDEVAAITINKATVHFHARYQNKRWLKNLLHAQQSAALKDILAKPVDTLIAQEKIFLVTFVAYRFRNNIFHGNKGVSFWLEYSEQIELCTKIMQVLVSYEEAIVPTMRVSASKIEWGNLRD